ncbi:hypothetical protein CFP56_010240 [Quercus suber]|uniref:DUF629 domain-containing protein n=1 Tax=Quercus suber TaxID=58331 RepID=A0AAW0L2Y0_QUESU
MKRLGMELLKIIQAEMHRLKNTWEKKYKHWRQGNLWQDMENKYRQQEIEKEKSDDEMQKLELKIIRIIFEAKADKDNKMLIHMHKDQLIGKRAKVELSNDVDYAVMSNGFDWKFLMSCCCGNTFLDVGKYKEHMTSKHCRPFPYERNFVALKSVPHSEIEIMEVTAATKFVEDWSRNESGDQDESQDLNLKPWPYCNDINRDNLMKKIHSILEVLIQTEYFTRSRLNMLKGLTLEMLKN